mgnify:CR=1 FL=1
MITTPTQKIFCGYYTIVIIITIIHRHYYYHVLAIIIAVVVVGRDSATIFRRGLAQDYLGPVKGPFSFQFAPSGKCRSDLR